MAPVVSRMAPTAPSDSVSALFGRGRAPSSLDVQRALASTEARLFGRAPTPLTLGRYIVLDRIGAGGFGVVHKAYDPATR